jgi:SecD/SecF fusion protein
MHSLLSFPAILAAADGVARKPATVTFIWGAVLIFLVFYYLGTAEQRRKKVVGTLLAGLMTVFCLWAAKDGLKLGMDLAGGSEFTVQLKPGTDDKGQQKEVTPDSVQQAIGILERRMNPDGAKVLLLAPQGEDRILILMPGV